MKHLFIMMLLLTLSSTQTNAETIGNGNGGFAVSQLKKSNPNLTDLEILQLAFEQAKGRIPSDNPFSGKAGSFYTISGGYNGTGQFKAGQIYSLESKSDYGPVLDDTAEQAKKVVRYYGRPTSMRKNNKISKNVSIQKMYLSSFSGLSGYTVALSMVENGSLVLKDITGVSNSPDQSNTDISYVEHYTSFYLPQLNPSYYYTDIEYRQVSEREIIMLQRNTDNVFPSLITYFWVE